MYDYFPEFDEGYSYTYTDSTSDSITTRVIESNSLPTEMLFGSESGANVWTNALLEVTYLDTSSLITAYTLFACCQYLTKTFSSDPGNTDKLIVVMYTKKSGKGAPFPLFLPVSTAGVASDAPYCQWHPRSYHTRFPHSRSPCFWPPWPAVFSFS